MKSDKGRDLVIMDRLDYVNRMNEVTAAPNFRKISKNPLPSMKTGLNTVLKDIQNAFGSATKWKLMVNVI